MVSRIRRPLAIAIAVLALGSIAASAAVAAAPTRVIEEVHISSTFPAGTRCPFEVVRSVDGTLVTTTFTGSDGLTTETRSFRDGKIVYLNPANGRTLTAVLAGPVVTADNGDGTSTVRVGATTSATPRPGSASSSATRALRSSRSTTLRARSCRSTSSRATRTGRRSRPCAPVSCSRRHSIRTGSLGSGPAPVVAMGRA